MKTVVVVAVVVALSACGPVGDGGAPGEEGEGEASVDDDGRFDGLTVALFRKGPGDVDLAVVVSGASPSEVGAEPVVVEVTLGSVPQSVALAERRAVLENVLSSSLRSARVAFVDADGHRGAAVDTAIADRAVKGAGAACDDSGFVDVCDAGFGCKGTPTTTCQAAEAPVVTNAAYQPSPDGPRLLIRGDDADDDVIAFDLAFKDDNGDPVLVDLDGDDVAESDGFSVDVARASHDGVFFDDVAMGLGFDADVNAIDVVVRDGNGLASAVRRVVFAPAPVRGIGAACDLDGFDVCGADAICAVVGARSLCRLASSAKSEVCADVEGVVVDDEEVRVGGSIAPGASLFATPEGCASGTARDRPEVVVALEVTRPLASLTVSTDVAGTACDTVVAVYAACTAAQPVGCNDDGASSLASTVVLTDVAPGTYIVVVESWDVAGGAFGLVAAPR